VDLTGYNGTYASYLLGLCNKKVLVKRTDGKVYRITADPKAKKNRKRKKTYGPEILAPLKRIWAIMDFPYGKRLAPSMEWFVPKLESCGELDVTPEVREKLLCISAATIDRLLQVEWKKTYVKRPLLHQARDFAQKPNPYQASSQWDDLRPGFTEIDLVGHEGGVSQGEFAFTLDVTDVATGWTEVRAVKNRAQTMGV
jgi:hypothetical protein